MLDENNYLIDPEEFRENNNDTQKMFYEAYL